MPCPQPWAQNAWTETRPRGPIAAMYSSPGPCYGLPPLTGYRDHDSRSGKRKEPAWTLADRHREHPLGFGPGPAAYEPGGNTRMGKNGVPAWSLAQKLKDPSRANFPGPGTYSPEDGSLPSGSRNPPSWSLADRTGQDKINPNPAPNAYTLPTMLGRKIPDSGKPNSPGVPLGSRIKDRRTDDTPGPTNYVPPPPGVYKYKEPTYSMTGKNFPAGAKGFEVSPASYRREEVCAPYHHAPASSFGIKHSQYLGSNVIEYKPEKC